MSFIEITDANGVKQKVDASVAYVKPGRVGETKQ